MRKDLDHAARRGGRRIDRADFQRSRGGDPAIRGGVGLVTRRDDAGRLDDDRALMPGTNRHLKANRRLGGLGHADAIIARAGVRNPARRIDLDPPKRGHRSGYRKSHRAIRLLGHRCPFERKSHGSVRNPTPH